MEGFLGELGTNVFPVIDEVTLGFVLDCLFPHVIFEHFQMVVKLNTAILLVQCVLPSLATISTLQGIQKALRVWLKGRTVGLPVALEYLLLLLEELLYPIFLALLVQLQVLDKRSVNLIMEMSQIFNDFGLFAEHLLFLGSVGCSNLAKN